MSSKEVDDAIGAAPDLDAQIATLEGELAIPTERESKATRLADLKRKKSEQNATELRGEAERRLLGIVRGLGSLVDQSRLDDNRLIEAARTFLDKARVLDERFQKITLLRHEAQALSQVFGLTLPDLPSAPVPAARKTVTEAFATVQGAPIAEHGFVNPVHLYQDGRPVRRTYEELGDLPGRDLVRRKIGTA